MTEATKYDPQAIETRWQQRWENDQLYRSKVDWSKPKYYALTMLPYPSGDLHIGHWFAMTPSDARARYMRMKGFNVLFPMGFDAFGLPAENAAIQRGVHPATWTHANIERMRGQLRSMGTMFDWERSAVSCEPEYYRWTEWFFKQFYESGLAYRSEALVNWSPTLQTVLANEQVIDGKDERTGQPVVQKLLTQWFFRMTKYADELLGYEGLDYPEPIKTMQTNWIGRSEGARVVFHTEQGNHPIEIFTTRPDTLWGATFMVLSPEHALVKQITTREQREAVEEYVKQAAGETELERTSDDREKTGVFTGAYAINPVNDERIPIWIADYVLISYGTGAIMAVPAHDERDFAFARKYGLPIRAVIQPEGETLDGATMAEAYPGAGVVVNSEPLNGIQASTDKGRKNPAINAAIDYIEQKGFGKESINFRMRDWLISRQRYWGSPIPIIYREDGSVESVPDNQLPVKLPEDVKMTGVGNPLLQSPTFVNTVDSQGKPARRETDTMDTFMCSSWYWYRYLSPHDDQQAFSPEEAAYWLPVDIYTGGAEHATMHLLYARWFAKAMRELGMFEETQSIMAEHGRDPSVMDKGEPWMLLRNQGQILGEERKGDFIRATGSWDGANKLFADSVDVVTAEEVAEPDPVAMAQITSGSVATAEDAMEGMITGEIVKRTENIVTVDVGGGALKTVEVRPDALISIPNIPGPNTVNQLKHHLEIQRMSKSKGNVVNPDEQVQSVGADTVRAYLMFGFDWAKGGPWDSKGIKGPRRWLEDVWDLVQAGAPTGAGDPAVERQIERVVHQTIEKVGRDLESLSFNTAIAAQMVLKNDVQAAVREGKLGAAVWQEAIRTMLLLMAPITPHIAEELWAQIGGAYSIHQQSWPEYDAAKAAEDVTTLVVMKNGKPIDRIEVSVSISEDEAKSLALASDGAKRVLNGDAPKRVIFIAGRGASNVEPKVNIVI
ncbi:MAG: leucine--tRNA ligase [Chloroflexi bacterium]|nr:leucine--tRNA ligase [Chloroflexota bacterium]